MSTDSLPVERELLKFQLGPVQDFIAQARSTRDLWSGSYILSWLIAHALLKVKKEGGLTNEDVIVPSLKNNPLVLALENKTCEIDAKQALVPNLPNIFLVSVPKGSGMHLGCLAKQEVHDELKRMGKSVWNFLEAEYGLEEKWKVRWDSQLKLFPQMSFAVSALQSVEAWAEAFALVGKRLAIRRNTRDFSSGNHVLMKIAVFLIRSRIP